MMDSKKIFNGKATAEVERLASICTENSRIDPSLYGKYEVKRGLRDLDGKGVLTGLTEISDVIGSKYVNGIKTSCKGELYYRGISIEKLIGGFVSDDRFGFEETIYLLIFGVLPNRTELDGFTKLLSSYRSLPKNFVRDVVMKAPNPDIMNKLALSVLTLYSYDYYANDISISNVLRQCLMLIANFPSLAVYSYHAYSHYIKKQSLVIHNPDPALSTAENILHMLRADSTYTHLEAVLLDMALVLHAEHGGGNNSTFTTHVVSSSGTDTYSSIAASLCSLKGPKHGGANIKVLDMMENIKKNVSDINSDEALTEYLLKILNKEAFDNAGLIYGMGHAVYSLSDPRAEIFKKYVEKLCIEKGCEDEFEFYTRVASIGGELIAEKRKIYKGVSPNIDFYSGLVYSMLGIPKELFTPLFAIARIAGWSAHRIEELINAGKIIRPAYMNVLEHSDYISMCDR